MDTKRFLITGVVMVAVALGVRPASATPVAPGGSVVPSAFAGVPGTLLATTGPVAFTSALGASDFSGTVIESVYADSSTGLMDFVYQFHNNASSAQAIEQMSNSPYGPFTADVQLDVSTGFGPFTAGGVAPASANRSVSGNNIAWQFAGTDLAPGATSAILMIKTNAPAFGPGNVSFINEGTATLTNMFAPVPEPGTVALLALGLVGLGVRRFARR
jgi:hypothetical protein